MSKKTTNTEETQQPSYVEDLLKNGTAVLTAKTRYELNEMINEIPAETKYGVGASGYNPSTGVYSLRVDITNS